MLKAAGWTQVSKDNLQPGDVLNKPADGNSGHVVIYVGGGMIYDQTSCVISSSGRAPSRGPKSGQYYIDNPDFIAWRAP